MDGVSGWQLLSNDSGKKKLLVLNLQLFYDNNNNNSHHRDCQRRTCPGSQAKAAAKHSMVTGATGLWLPRIQSQLHSVRRVLIALGKSWTLQALVFLSLKRDTSTRLRAHTAAGTQRALLSQAPNHYFCYFASPALLNTQGGMSSISKPFILTPAHLRAGRHHQHHCPAVLIACPLFSG